jgi:peptide/nickel transport system permease protein
VSWWIRPAVRIFAAVLLPLVVPLVIAGILWALPGDPVEILCPPGICTGQEELAQRWCMDAGPTHFYSCWLSNAVVGDFGRSIRVMQGQPVAELMFESMPTTGILVLLALVPVVGFSVLAALGWLPRRLDALWQGVGLVPSVILALLFAAAIEINLGPDFGADPVQKWLRLLAGALVLGVADGTLAGAVIGTRSVFDEEIKQRYIQIALLRGESPLANALPNVTPALIGQFRGRVLHLLSGAVVVEVVLGISGLGELLWDGTLLQDFFVVLAAAWAFSILSGVMLLVQATAEILVEMHVRRAPPVPVDTGRTAPPAPTRTVTA